MIEMVTFIRLIEKCRFDTCCLFKILFIVSVLQFLVHMIYCMERNRCINKYVKDTFFFQVSTFPPTLEYFS